MIPQGHTGELAENESVIGFGKTMLLQYAKNVTTVKTMGFCIGTSRSQIGRNEIKVLNYNLLFAQE
jgi:hypothetical protein